MKTKATLIKACVLMALAVFSLQSSTASAQGTAFTYQGQLQNNGSPANGIYDLKLLIYDSSTGDNILAGPVTNTAVAVTNGLFTTIVDFGAGAFTGGSNWLHLGVRTNGAANFTALSPRQQLTATPYAIYAENASAAGLSGTVSLAQLPGVVVTNNETSVALGSVAVSGNSQSGGLAVDPTAQNSGTIGSYSLTFGAVVGSSGEGIASKRTNGVNDLEFYTDWGNRMTILNNGNVGINTNNPTATLDVNGGLHISGMVGLNGGLNLDQYAHNTNFGISAYALAFGATSGNTGEGIVSRRGGPNDLEFFTGWNNRMTILNNGNVGINTTNPAATLDVNGSLNVEGNINLTGTFTGNGGGLTNVTAATLAIPQGMALIPAGSFTMGNSIGDSDITDATPTNITVSAFYMDINLVSYAQWQSVYFWATNLGYGFMSAGAGKAANHPVQTVDWYDSVKWSNARSQQAGLTPVYYTDAVLTQVYTNGEVTPYMNMSANGYRLPTEAEWEKAARGGLNGQRFPWGNVITENLANYTGVTASYSYDLGPNGNNTAFTNGASPYTSPVGYFAPNGYGLYDMADDVTEWCWDWHGTPYGQPTNTNPTGPATGSYRVLRGGSWFNYANVARCASRFYVSPSHGYSSLGFRCVRGH